MKTNTEMLHAMWLGQYREYCRKHLASNYGASTEEAIIFGYGPGSEARVSFEDLMYGGDAPIDDFYEVKASFRLPRGSFHLMYEMAKSCQASLLEVPISGVNFVMNRFFNLEAILCAAYPKNLDTGRFKGTIGGMLLDAVEVDDDTAPHVAFAGLGAILMDECRKGIMAHGSDEEVCEMSRELWLGTTK